MTSSGQGWQREAIRGCSRGVREETKPLRLMEREEGNQQGVVSESQEERVEKEGAGNVYNMPQRVGQHEDWQLTIAWRCQVEVVGNPWSSICGVGRTAGVQ